MTLAEILLWNELKGKQMMGYDFHRQKPIGKYVVDFFCPRLSLVIEIDGISHEGKLDKDRQRQEEIEKNGIHFLRFPDHEVKKNLEGVLWEIREWIEAYEKREVERTHPSAKKMADKSIPSLLHASSRCRGDLMTHPLARERRIGNSSLAYTVADAAEGTGGTGACRRRRTVPDEKSKDLREHTPPPKRRQTG